MEFWDWSAQKSVGEVEAIIRAREPEIESGTTLWWAVATSENGAAIGECDLSEIDKRHKRAEIGFLFARAYWGNGYALEAARALVAHAFGPLGLERVGARCHAGNMRSVGLLERLGFQFEGRLKEHLVREGERRDCLLYGLLRR
jgi:RimJ/RimL family protein N-acetyltransferase